ncbi:hypothetical protein BJF96_g2710 [Verticillium dahliae]|uniref:Uncharacterized protein n=1 Tax=Verticillium dahliae TaxID=27337 RepID=A0AA44WNQ9_VERDA|nr:hypothetical protein BJF96_g2710 [Verticillium dahliae]
MRDGLTRLSGKPRQDVSRTHTQGGAEEEEEEKTKKKKKKKKKKREMTT